MRKGKIDPMVFILLGAVVGCALMFTCYQVVTKTLGPSLALTGAASEQFGKTVNVTDKDGAISVMITDTATAVDAASSDTTANTLLAREIARWVLAKRTDTTAVNRIHVNTFRTVKGSVLPKMVHGVTFRGQQLDSLRNAAGRDSLNTVLPKSQ
jgi:hypothetical protein